MCIALVDAIAVSVAMTAFPMVDGSTSLPVPIPIPVTVAVFDIVAVAVTISPPRALCTTEGDCASLLLSAPQEIVLLLRGKAVPRGSRMADAAFTPLSFLLLLLLLSTILAISSDGVLLFSSAHVQRRVAMVEVVFVVVSEHVSSEHSVFARITRKHASPTTPFSVADFILVITVIVLLAHAIPTATPAPSSFAPAVTHWPTCVRTGPNKVRFITLLSMAIMMMMFMLVMIVMNIMNVVNMVNIIMKADAGIAYASAFVDSAWARMHGGES